MLNLFRGRGKKSTAQPTIKKVQKMPELDDFLANMDYEGAISLLNHKLKSGNLEREEDDSLRLWVGFCFYRLRLYDQAADVYTHLMSKENAPVELGIFLACCKFYMKQYAEAKLIAEKCPKSPLCIRLMMNVALKLNDEKKILTFHSSLGSAVEDQLALAGINFCRMHYQDAIELYMKILAQNPNLLALNINMAVCYAKMDYPHVAYNLVKNYLRSYPTSPFAKNLLMAVLYRTITSKATIEDKSELAKNLDSEGMRMASDMEALLKEKLYPDVEHLCRHNLVLFKNCDTALQVFPALMKHVPEARLNLIIYNLNTDNVNDAMQVCQDLDPLLPYDFLVKALCFLRYGQLKQSGSHLKIAENFFQMVGESDLVKDTIAGRQSSAAHHFLAGKYDEVIRFLESVQLYFKDDDLFHFNLAQAYLMDKKYQQAEDTYCLIVGPERDRQIYKFMLSRCYIRNKKPQKAWDIMTKCEHPDDRKALLRLLAHDCYIANEFYFATKAFHEMEKIDPSPDNWNGKKGACAGLFRLLANHKSDQLLIQQMREVIPLFESSHHSNSEFLVRIIRSWGDAHNVTL